MRTASADLLEYEDLKRLLRRFTSSPLGRSELDALAPIADRQAIEGMLADTAEAMEHDRLLENPQPSARGSAIRVRFNDLPDCREAAAKLRIEGASLEALEILAFTQLLDLATEIRTALSFSEEPFPRLAGRAAGIGEFRPLLKELSGKILPDGALADDASVALGRLRREIERQKRKIHESLERFLRAHREEGVLQEEFVTIRNDRFVVPLVAGQHKRIEGVVHGASGTGHTLFVEPLESISLNNELVHLVEQEAREVHRILREMTERLRSAAGEIGATVKIVGELEFIFAKARFAREFECVIPVFSSPAAPRLLLREARHPLLQDVLRRQKKRVVPVSLELAGDQRTLLVSGPNTGGKTVTLKTVGLLALMAQSGVPVPCAEAELPVFQEALADIGDNQSIQESLSTFSAHITRIREMLDEVTPDSLALLDELGRATDPGEGGALGIAVLEQLRSSGAFTLATTHLMALKVYGANTPGVLNGSMGFDDRTLQPTYQLRTGAPGKSAGLEIAGRLGIPPAVIERARQAMTVEERDISRFVNQLHERLEQAGALQQELEDRRRKIEERESSLAKDWERREKAKLAELERRAEAAMAQFEERTAGVIEEIERSSQERKAASEARRKVSRAKREFREEIDSSVLGKTEARPAAANIAEGVTVRLKGIGSPARVRRLLGRDLIEVEAGFLKLQVPVDDVVEVLPAADTARLPKNVTFESGPRWDVSSREINVIGRRAEEACAEVDKFLDNAALASVNRVRIVHGHGMGILKRAIAELLAANPHVEKYYPAPQSEGGAGATIAELKE
ncbi:MAG: endonuclease MutS2 [Bryobacteraceae bacterium]|nr:endonuclease MutS2 [Bryobacteraceae bacterium]